MKTSDKISPMNDKFTIRRVNARDIPALVACHITTWKAAFVPILTAEQVALKDLDTASQARIWQRRLAQEENHSRYTFIAMMDNKLTGYITGVQHTGEPSEYTSELHQLYVLPEAQGCGIGRQLVGFLAEHLIIAGHRSMLVWVMTQNPAVRFYRDVLSGEYIAERLIPDADGILKEAAYGWSIPRLRQRIEPRSANSDPE